MSCFTKSKLLNVGLLAVCTASIVTTCCAHIDRADPEFLALRYIRHIQEAESKFQDGNARYGDLTELGPRGANLISPELASGSHESYTFRLSAAATHYQIQARPIHWGDDAPRSFYSDETQIIRQNTTYREATPDSRPYISSAS